MATVHGGNIESPDETRTFPKGKFDLITMGGVTFDWNVLEPGWKWSECNKPLRNTPSCQGPYNCYVLAGRLHLLMDDRAEAVIGPGNVAPCLLRTCSL